MSSDAIFYVLGICVVAAPAVLWAVLGVTSLIGLKFNERALSHCTQIVVVTGLGSAIIILAMMLAFDMRHVPVELGNLVAIPQ